MRRGSVCGEVPPRRSLSRVRLTRSPRRTRTRDGRLTRLRRFGRARDRAHASHRRSPRGRTRCCASRRAPQHPGIQLLPFRPRRRRRRPRRRRRSTSASARRAARTPSGRARDARRAGLRREMAHCFTETHCGYDVSQRTGMPKQHVALALLDHDRPQPRERERVRREEARRPSADDDRPPGRGRDARAARGRRVRLDRLEEPKGGAVTRVTCEERTDRPTHHLSHYLGRTPR